MKKQIFSKTSKLLFMTMAIFTISVLWGKNKIEGAGASFPFPIYSKMFAQYYQKTKIKVNYQSIGSGGGIRQIKNETVDFGATDAFIKDDNLRKINQEKGRKLVHLPTVLGGVSITYNFDQKNKKTKLKLDGKTIAEIFMGKISQWNDSKIRKLNPGVSLPNKKIIVVRRSDGSGTTATFTDFLAFYSPEWKEIYGVGKTINWFRKSIGGKGNEGVTGQIKNIPYSIGYVSLNYALKAKLPVVAVKNSKGKFILPTVQSVSAAANTRLPKDTRINLTSIEGSADSYPISTFTWLIFYQEQNYKKRTKNDAKNLKTLLNWLLTNEAQKEAQPLYYAPLPQEAIKHARKIVESITYQGKKI